MEKKKKKEGFDRDPDPRGMIFLIISGSLAVARDRGGTVYRLVCSTFHSRSFSFVNLLTFVYHERERGTQ